MRHRKKHITLTIKQKLSLLCSLAILIPCVLVSVYFVQRYFNDQRKHIMMSAQTYLDELQMMVEHRVDSLTELSNEFAQNNKLIDYFGKPYTYDSSYHLMYQDIVGPTLKRIEHTNPNLIHKLTVFFNNPEVPENGNQVLKMERLLSDPVYADFYYSNDQRRLIWDGKGTIFDTDDDGQPKYKFLRKLFHVNGRQMCVVMYSVTPENLLYSILNSKQEQTVVVRQSGQILFRSDGAAAGDETQKEESWLSVTTLDSGLEIDMQVDATPLENLVKSTQIMYISICLGIVLMIVTLNAMMGLVFRKLIRVVETMNHIAKDDFQGSIIEDETNDEIGHIIRTFNNLLGELNESVRRLLEKEREKKDMEILALQYQINPHFICNALHSIQLAVENNGEMEVADAINEFVKVLRYNISGDMSSTIGREINHGLNYIRFINAWRACPIRVCCTVPEGLERLHMIKYVLQPILENAVYHSRQPDTLPMDIDIEVSAQADLVHLVVRNTASQIDAGRLLELNRQLAREHNPISEGSDHSIGLANIAFRLKLQYGMDSRLWLVSAQEKTEVHLQFRQTRNPL